ncbi:MAG: transposase, partial [Acidobacteria bacterium]|nr:transposase [Acidobacteriota bacterium]
MSAHWESRGNAEIKGTLRVVVEAGSDRVEVHQTHPLEGVLPELTGVETETAGVDIGITEVFTDEQGNRYGTELGSFLEKTSEQLRTKGQRRNKLHAVRKAAWTTGDREKANRIRKFNLGTKKQREMTRKQRQTAARIINTAIYSLVAVRQMKILGVEKLDFRTPTPSKALSRRVMLLSRSLLNDRLDFVASAKGFRREDTNSAYSSQTCPNCWFPHPANRRGDRFQCTHLQCRHADIADRVGAEHTKRRVNDPEIRTWTPRWRVKELLLARHLAWKKARLEPPERP